MIIASIDIGTNTVLQLIADADPDTKEIRTIKNFYKMPRIGKGVTLGTNISEDKIEVLIEILKEYIELAEKQSAEKIIVTATNAMRISSNGNEIAQKVKDNLGLDIKIIKGEEEALYSYLGAVSATDKEKSNLVIDIGGGSTEIILGKNNDVLYKKSFQIGVVTLTEKFINHYPPAEYIIDNMEEFINNTFIELTKYSEEDISAVAVAGTPTTLSCIKQNIKEYADDKVENSVLSINDLEILASEISKLTTNEITENYGSVVLGREDVLLSGTLILKTICSILNIDEIIVSSKGLRYGAIINYLNCLE